MVACPTPPRRPRARWKRSNRQGPIVSNRHADDDPFPAQTFLQAVAADGDVDLVALCIRFGADLERRNHSGETALGYACSWGHLSVVKLLVEAGADINAVEHDPEDDVRNTALDSAMDHPDVVDYLRGVGAKRITDLGDA